MNPGWRRSVLKHKPSVDNNQLTVGDYNNGGGGRYYDNQIGNSLLAAPPPGTRSSHPRKLRIFYTNERFQVTRGLIMCIYIIFLEIVTKNNKFLLLNFAAGSL